MRRDRALVFFPQGDGLPVIESLRRKFDPLANEIAAHATLVFPFTSEISEVDLRAHVERALEGQQPFRVRFEGVSAVAEDYLFLDAVVGSDRLRDLHERLYRGPLSAFRSTAHVYRPIYLVYRFGLSKRRAERYLGGLRARERRASEIL